jgi:hypothetical protein
MTTLKGGKAVVANSRPRDALGHFTPEASVSEQISGLKTFLVILRVLLVYISLEIRRRIQENESANSQMRNELQKKMEELESIRKQTRESDSTPNAEVSTQ